MVETASGGGRGAWPVPSGLRRERVSTTSRAKHGMQDGSSWTLEPCWGRDSAGSERAVMIEDRAKPWTVGVAIARRH